MCPFSLFRNSRIIVSFIDCEVLSTIRMQQIRTVHIRAVTGSSPVSCAENVNENPDYL